MGRLKNFLFRVQKVLPLVYDDSLSYYEVLEKVVVYLNDTIDVVNDLDDKYDAIAGRMDNAESSINSINDSIADIYNEIENIGGELNNIYQDIDRIEDKNSEQDDAISGLQDSVATAENDIDDLEEQMAGTTDSGLKTMIQHVLPPYTRFDWGRSLRIINTGINGRYMPGWEPEPIVSFASGNISVTNATLNHCTAIRSGNVVQIDLEATATVDDDVFITISKYRPIGSAGDLHWYIPVSVSDGTWASNAWELNSDGTEVTGYIYNMSTGDTLNIHLVYITGDLIEEPA